MRSAPPRRPRPSTRLSEPERLALELAYFADLYGSPCCVEAFVGSAGARAGQALAALELRRPQALGPDERAGLERLARNLPRLWSAPTTSDRDRKELLRTILAEAVVTVRRPEAGEPHAEVELFWEGGARSELRVRLNHRGAERHRTDEDTIALVRRLAEHPGRAAHLAGRGVTEVASIPHHFSRVSWKPTASRKIGINPAAAA